MFPISKRLLGAGISGALVLGLAVTAAARTGSSSDEPRGASVSSPTSSSTPVTAPSSSVPTTTPATNAADQPAPGGETATHLAGEAGQVTISRSGDALSIVNVTPNGGWTFEVEQSSGRELEVKFTAAGARVDFNAELEDGQVRIRVRDRATDDDRSGPGHGDDDRDVEDRSGPGHGGDDDRNDDRDVDDRSGPGHGGGDDRDDRSGRGSGHGGDDRDDDDDDDD